jgi:hypothetical protein
MWRSNDHAGPEPSGAARVACPEGGVTFGATSVRIDVRPIELTHLDARWDRNGMLSVELSSERPPATRISLEFRIDKAILPGGTGRFEGRAQSAGLESRACKVTGTISAPTIPARLTKESQPFDVDLDVTLDACEPESVLAPLVLRGHVQLQLSRALPPEL